MTMINGLNKALSHLADAFRGRPSDDAAYDGAVLANVNEAALSWHGDHWQNLLSSPMDARRYILEDWNDTVETVADVDDDVRIDSFSGRKVRSFS
ncbi:hypothetical protein [Robbsia andropogonis]|nr:hypothetical protein [Robbsia andropogonis]MCP1129861.1 hypothetical protein [Robbsia andropogonis]